LKRYDGDEIYHWQVADGHYCDLQICQYQYKIINYNAFLFGKSDSIFPNGRTVIRCDFKGDLN
jgi:hypothetical protein